MTDLLPLTSAELADLKAKAKAAKRPGPRWVALRDLRVAANPEIVLRLVDMVERRDAWRPIETAPKDETVVLLYCPDSWDTDGIRIGWWFGGGWYDDESASHSIADLYGEPTRWMPRPEPPK